MHVELGDLTPEYRAFVCVETAGTHDVSNLDWRRPNVWSTSEDQIQTVSQSVENWPFFQTIISRGSDCQPEPLAPSFFGTLVQDNLRSRYVSRIQMPSIFLTG